MMGRWSKETTFLAALAKARAESSPFILQGRVQAALIRRWSAMLACSAARAFAVSLLDRRPVPGTGGVIWSVHEVLRGARFGKFACEVGCPDVFFSFVSSAQCVYQH